MLAADRHRGAVDRRRRVKPVRFPVQSSSPAPTYPPHRRSYQYSVAIALKASSFQRREFRSLESSIIRNGSAAKRRPRALSRAPPCSRVQLRVVTPAPPRSTAAGRADRRAGRVRAVCAIRARSCSSANSHAGSRALAAVRARGAFSGALPSSARAGARSSALDARRRGARRLRSRSCPERADRLSGHRGSRSSARWRAAHPVGA